MNTDQNLWSILQTVCCRPLPHEWEHDKVFVTGKRKILLDNLQTLIDKPDLWTDPSLFPAFFVFGEYGTGKSVVLNYLHKYFENLCTGERITSEIDFNPQIKLFPVHISLVMENTFSEAMKPIIRALVKIVGHDIENELTDEDKETLIKLAFGGLKETDEEAYQVLKRNIMKGKTKIEKSTLLPGVTTPSEKFNILCNLLVKYSRKMGFDGIILLVDESETLAYELQKEGAKTTVRGGGIRDFMLALQPYFFPEKEAKVKKVPGLMGVFSFAAGNLGRLELHHLAERVGEVNQGSVEISGEREFTELAFYILRTRLKYITENYSFADPLDQRILENIEQKLSEDGVYPFSRQLIEFCCLTLVEPPKIRALLHLLEVLIPVYKKVNPYLEDLKRGNDIDIDFLYAHWDAEMRERFPPESGVRTVPLNLHDYLEVKVRESIAKVKDELDTEDVKRTASILIDIMAFGCFEPKIIKKGWKSIHKGSIESAAESSLFLKSLREIDKRARPYYLKDAATAVNELIDLQRYIEYDEKTELFTVNREAVLGRIAPRGEIHEDKLLEAIFEDYSIILEDIIGGS